MSELLDNPPSPIQEIDDEAPVQYFCKFTFAQFFTIMILAVFTLGFMFYIGARYGNDYLRLGQTSSGSVNTASISTIPSGVPMDGEKGEEMLKTAREALQATQTERLQGQVATMLQNPGVYQQQMAQQAGAYPPGAVPPGAVPPGAVSPQMAQGMSPQDQAIAAIQAQQAQQQAQQQYGPPGGQVPAAVPTTVARTSNERVNEYETPAATPPQQAMPAPRDIPQQPTADDEPAGQPTQKSAGGSTYSVQVAASQNMTEANQWVQTWRDRGYSAFMMVADLPEKGRWYRVRLGSFPTRDTAENFAGQLKAKEQVEAIAVQNE